MLINVRWPARSRGVWILQRNCKWKIYKSSKLKGGNKPIAAVCHGAQVLAAAGVLKGRSCSAYPAVGPDVQIAGGEFMDIPVDQAHVDGNLVTAPAWPAHPAWLAQFLQVLGTKIEL
jgi:protease I